MRQRVRQSLAGCCLCALGCQAFVGDYVADLGEAPATTNTAELCDIELDEFVFDLDLETTEAHDNLEAYYEAANPELVAHLAAVADTHMKGERHARITYLRGAAGVGKSFVTRNLTDAFEDSAQCVVSLAEAFMLEADSLGFEVEQAADLATLDGTTVFNTLPNVSQPSRFSLLTLLEAAGCFDEGTLTPLVILDGLDEIHSDASTLLLEELDDYVLSGAEGAGDFVHFLVSGRPEGFARWLTAPERTRANTAIVDQFDLTPPVYDTAGDLAYRVKSYLEFARMPAPQPQELESHVESFVAALLDYPFLRYSIGNLAVGNIVIDQTAPGLTLSERSLKEGMFDDLLVRNAATHGRPGTDNALSGVYRRMLEDIAAQYVDVDQSGRFTVRSEDTVPVTDDGGTPLGRARVRNVLDRAGVAFLTEPRTSTTRYRFEPFWLQAHLIERRNQRLHAGYAYQACY